MIRFDGGRLSAAFVLAVLFCGPASAQEASTQPNYLTQPRQAEGTEIESVLTEIRTPSGDAARDAEALKTVQDMAGALPGSSFSTIEIARVTARMAKAASVLKVDFRLLPAGANAVRVEFLVDAAPKDKAATGPSGVLTGSLGDFPIFYRDDRSLVTAIVAGGLGVYSDGNPWFGQPELFNKYNPLAGHLPGRRASWTEGSLELGGGFAAQLGDKPLYAFGALTGMKTWSIGQDIYRDDTRDFDAVEKAYAGILYADPVTNNNAKLSVGRQVYTINDGFLVNLVKGSVNAGDRGATYLGPRLANDFSVLADGRIGDWGFHAFYIDPNEIEELESESTFLGLNLQYNVNGNAALDATVMTVPHSLSTYANPYGLTLKREGVTTAAAHLLWKRIAFDGVWFEGEAAHQSNPDYAMSAWAGYGTLGYIARKHPWTPSLSYRYAYFSGDDPHTAAYERYDPMLNSGLGIWLQGISFGKITTNSNLAVHRIQLNVVPVDQLDVTFDYHRLAAPELNNMGSNPAISTLASHDIGQEISMTARWAINRNFYLQSVASFAMPGEALKEIGADKNWSTLQLSLY